MRMELVAALVRPVQTGTRSQLAQCEWSWLLPLFDLRIQGLAPQRRQQAQCEWSWLLPLFDLLIQALAASWRDLRIQELAPQRAASGGSRRNASGAGCCACSTCSDRRPLTDAALLQWS